MLIKSKVPMPVYRSKYNNLNQSQEYRENFDRIFRKQGIKEGKVNASEHRQKGREKIR